MIRPVLLDPPFSPPYTESVANLHIGRIPEDIKKRFRAICKERGQTMTETVISFTKRAVGEDIMRIATEKFSRRRRSK